MSLSNLLAGPSRLVTAISRRVSIVKLPSEDDDAEQQLPLNPFTIDDPESDEEVLSTRTPHPPPPTKRISPPPPSTSRSLRILKRLTLILFSILLLSTLIHYIYSDPERWPTPWSELLSPSSTLTFQTLVPAAGRRYQGFIHPGENVLGWKGIRYAISPTGKRRFRKAVPIKVPVLGEGEEGEVVQAIEADEGCPRPNPDGGEGYVGKEDCLS
ncbi:hypothetical protein P7C70_g9308, partial [Phenoliferia sp. Uapishka_3]